MITIGAALIMVITHFGGMALGIHITMGTVIMAIHITEIV